MAPWIFVFFKGDKDANRFGPAFATDEKKALTVLLLNFIPYLLLFILGFIAGLSGATLSSVKTEQTVNQIQVTVTNIHTIFKGQKNYKAVNNMKTMHSLGVIGDDICNNAQCDNPTNLFGGAFLLSSEEDNGYATFVLVYGGLPQDACVEFATRNWGDQNSSGFVGMAIHPHEEFSTSLSDEAARKMCSAENNVVALEWL